MASSIPPILSGQEAPSNTSSSYSTSSASDLPPRQTTTPYTPVKPEPLDDDNFFMEGLKEGASFTAVATLVATPVARYRGRPRKHLIPVESTGPRRRTQTGCLTCRKRKKKCDEAKPECKRCVANAYECEYLQKRRFESTKVLTLGRIPLQPIFGLETREDIIFWKHCIEHLGIVLTVEEGRESAFENIMVPIALNHQGLMHSLLSLASKHIAFDAPSGLKILEENPSTTIEALHERSMYHSNAARGSFRDTDTIEDNILARYGQILCFLLEALVEGSSHRPHLSAYRRLITTYTPNDAVFFSFISELFEYYIYADELVHFALDPTSHTVSDRTYPEIIQPRLIGVADGLLDYLSRTTALRDMIRGNMSVAVEAAEIDFAIRHWVPDSSSGNRPEVVGYIYKLMAYIHLLRVLYPPSETTAAIMPLPQAQKLLEAVERSLKLINSLSSRDRRQRLLLLPCFIIGTASVAQKHQDAIRIAIKTIRGYTGMRHVDNVLHVLEEIWQFMGAGEWMAVWDWPGIAHKIDVELIPA
ncbi:fungal-specific transcription factor domain-containing protein [Triangularia verruculosa]|uniref:Fungal-specific transcription factor domain-containing protein n=1 Tax=Triangularia verruculosa TaxID=2587418 RepID=A0AAN6XQU4_9PEZI|nr:fungal-specific transcription factor domain-containing protein [Triangularia verruculosa]